MGIFFNIFPNTVIGTVHLISVSWITTGLKILFNTLSVSNIWSAHIISVDGLLLIIILVNCGVISYVS